MAVSALHKGYQTTVVSAQALAVDWTSDSYLAPRNEGPVVVKLDGFHSAAPTTFTLLVEGSEAEDGPWYIIDSTTRITEQIEPIVFEPPKYFRLRMTVKTGTFNTSLFIRTYGIEDTSLEGLNGETAKFGVVSEDLTLSTGGATTDTTRKLLPANSLILGVMTRVTTTITTAVNFQVGDASTAGRFAGVDTNITAGDVAMKMTHWAAGTEAQWQAAAAKVRITANVTPGAGAIRITVFFMKFDTALS